MNQSLFTLGVAFTLASVSQAAILVDNFDSYPADNTTSMNGLGTWSVSNGTSGANAIAVTTDSTFEGSAGAALIGGYAPGSAGPTVLSSSPTVGMFGASPTTFTMDFGFYDSTDLNRDNYSIKLTSTGGANLLTIDLSPAAGVNTFNISFSSAFFSGTLNWGTLDALDTAGNPYFQVQFQTSTDGLGGMFYSLDDLNGSNMSSGSLSGAALTDSITGLSISVDTTGGAGDGFLIVDNVSVIPEPSSALLGLLGASCAFLRRRRA
jgi:hypothetical protein